MAAVENGGAFEDSPATLHEKIGREGDTDSMMAIAFARRWPEGVAFRDLKPWQRFGPDLLYAVCFQDDSERPRFMREAVAHMQGLKWVARKRLSRLQLIMAANDAVDRIIYRTCQGAEVSAAAVACRKETYLDLRAEAVAFLAAGLERAADEYIRARYGIERR